MHSSGTRLIAAAVAIGALALAVLLAGNVARPYVVTAIDYHFHDAHPTLPIGPGRDLVVKNAGRTVHNVTIPALGYSKDVAAGEQVTIGAIADRLAPGRYQLYCRIHLETFGMKGVIVISAE